MKTTQGECGKLITFSREAFLFDVLLLPLFISSRRNVVSNIEALGHRADEAIHLFCHLVAHGTLFVLLLSFGSKTFYPFFLSRVYPTGRGHVWSHTGNAIHCTLGER